MATRAASHTGRLLLASTLALFTAGLAASLRAGAAADWQRDFFDPVDPAHSAEMTGAALGAAFLGFALTVAAGSLIADAAAAAFLLAASGGCVVAGTLVTMYADSISSGAGVYHVLYAGSLVTGIGWGLAEVARRDTRHVWWPGGLMTGGLLAYVLGKAGVGWQAELGLAVIPAVAVAVLSLASKASPVEREASIVPMGQRFRDLLHPLALILLLAACVTAVGELAPGQWIDLALTRPVQMRGVLLLACAGGIMLAGRRYAARWARRIPPIILAWCSCMLASLGLVTLGLAGTPVAGALGATLWGAGICFLWPAMRAAARERFPRGGALLAGWMQAAGALTVWLVLPAMGRVLDGAKSEAAANAAVAAAAAGAASFRSVAYLPAILLVVFGALWVWSTSAAPRTSQADRPPQVSGP